jgi:hypothetical protein
MEDSEVTCHFTSFVLFNIFVNFGLQLRIFSTKASQSRSGIPDASTFVMAANKTLIFMRCLQHFSIFLNNQPDAPTIQIYSIIKLYIFGASVEFYD